MKVIIIFDVKNEEEFKALKEASELPKERWVLIEDKHLTELQYGELINKQ